MVTVFTFLFHDGELFLGLLGEKTNTKKKQEKKEEQRTGFVPESPHELDPTDLDNGHEGGN